MSPTNAILAAVRRIWLTSAMGGMALMVHGCVSVSPPPAPLPFDIPAAWSAPDGSGTIAATSLAQWWLRFGDPVLASLEADAMRANTSVQGAQAALREARAQRDVSAAALLPSVGSSASAQRSTAGGKSLGNSFRVGLDASWELDIFGANRDALNASEALVEATHASLGDVQVSIAAEVALAYITLRAAQVHLAIAQDNLATQLETLQITEWRVQAGLATSLDFEQARTSTEQTRALLPALRTNADQARHALAVLTGRPPAALSTILAAAGPIPEAPSDLAMSFPAETLRQRPDVRAAEYQVTAASARVAQADAARLPSFNIGGTLGLASLTLGALTSGSSVLSTLAAGVAMPIFEGGALLAQVRAQQAALDQAQLAYQAAVLTALKDVEDALVALQGDRERLAHLQLAAEAAGNASLLARQRYSSGLVDFQTVLDTQRSQLTTQESVANAVADLGADHVRLYKALGGGWRPRECGRYLLPHRRHVPEGPNHMNAPIPPAVVATKQEPRGETDLATLLDEPAASAWYRRPMLWAGVALLALAGAGAWYWQQQQTANAAPRYATETVRRGNLTLTVTANGTLQPTRSIAIGSELSGTVLKVNVDVNDRIKKGQVLVEFDTSKLHDQILRSRASLAAANAKVAQTVATVKEAQATLGRFEEVARLSGGKVPSKTELDSARATQERAQADELSARASVNDAQAALSTDEINLSKASIRAPADGVILTRNVDPGNAVAASLQAVTLFTVAEDLTRLRLQVNVDEADVGAVTVGQTASFTVSAYPGRKYPAVITRVAFGSTITDNVVTYVTYLDVDNTDLTLRPGMTATATITATNRNDVLLVPNTALRFEPATAGASAAGAKGGIVASLTPRMPRRGPRSSAADSANTALARQVWVLRDGAAVPIAVTPGISDGRMTEITGGELQVGMEVITDQKTSAAK